MTDSSAGPCPKCGHETVRSMVECPKCGVILAKARIKTEAAAEMEAAPAAAGASRIRLAAKLHADEHGLYSPPSDEEQESTPADQAASPPALDRADRKALWIGAAIGALLFVVPPTRYLTNQFLSTLVHELGHAVAYWAFGHIAIPSFDLLRGGGVTMSLGQLPLLLPLPLFFFCRWWWQAKGFPRLQTAIAAIIVAYVLLAFTKAHLIVVALAGLGGEAVFAVIFVYRALSDTQSRFNRFSIERPAYAAAATCLALQLGSFAVSLASSETFRSWYLAGKVGLRSDLDFVADQLGLEFSTVTMLFLPVALSPVLLGLFYWRTEQKLWASLRSVLS